METCSNYRKRAAALQKECGKMRKQRCVRVRIDAGPKPRTDGAIESRAALRHHNRGLWSDDKLEIKVAGGRIFGAINKILRHHDCKCKKNENGFQMENDNH